MKNQKPSQLRWLAIAPEQIDLDRQTACFTPAQQHYLRHVLRSHPGERLIVTDGQGQAWLAQLIAADISVGIAAKLLDPIPARSELAVAVTLIAALPKGNGFDAVVRQAVELGVACIAPVLSERTLLRPSRQKCDRWQRIAQEAAEQSERLAVPPVLEPVSLSVGLETWQPTAHRYLCVARHSAPSLLSCLEQDRGNAEIVGNLAIAIGPEGGWTDAEVETAIGLGYQPVSLGSRILRAVTAPVASLSLVSAVFDPGTRPKSS